MTREEFDRLYGEFLDLAKELQGIDRHGRGGTTIGELFASDAFAEGLMAVYEDPLYIQSQVEKYLEWWCGERDTWSPTEGNLLSSTAGPSLGVPGITMLGKENRNGEELPSPQEIGLRASRAKSMTPRKAEPRITELYEHAKLCLDLAEAFEKRLEDEGGIRRVQ
jgi:hypothetical protein